MQQTRTLLIFSNNCFYKEWFYRETERKHLRLSLWDHLTLWRPCSHFCITLASLWLTQLGSEWLYVALVPLYVIPASLWLASPSAMSLRVPASPLPSFLTATNHRLFLHPATLPLKSISSTWELIFLEILNICQYVSKWSSSLLLYFSCWWINSRD